jgi:hypothetical protein
MNFGIGSSRQSVTLSFLAGKAAFPGLRKPLLPGGVPKWLSFFPP